MSEYKNPFRPGAGHPPLHLAGRQKEKEEFQHLLKQEVVMQNMIITGLRGIGKTVLLESFRPVAHRNRWLWAGTDCSEAASLNEMNMVVRLLTDIALITSSIKIDEKEVRPPGFSHPEKKEVFLNYDFLVDYFLQTPGLTGDKLKRTLSFVWECIEPYRIVKGIVFAYDEAQTLSDHAEDKEYPLSLLLDVFQYLQKKGVPFMLVLTGLPTLLSKLVETRTYSERLFRVFVLDRLSEEESRLAVTTPITKAGNKITFDKFAVDTIIEQSDGYPYFIQFISREVYDVFAQNPSTKKPSIPVDAIIQKLDNDFFAGRWANATDRERELLVLVAESGLSEFRISQIAEFSKNKEGIKPFGASQINQMLNRLIENGLIYKNRRASYSFAVPLLERYILRRREKEKNIEK